MHHHQGLNRRAVIAMLAATPFVAGCKDDSVGAVDIRWNREVCEICGMLISDPRFAAEVRGGPDNSLAKFDDIGDAVHWLKFQDWAEGPTEFWVRDYDTGTAWLDARAVRYVAGVVSPMDYGFGAVAATMPDTVSFDEMVEAVIAHGLSSRCHAEEVWGTVG